MILAIKNRGELEEKYKGADINKIIDRWMNYYNKKPFKDKIKNVWCDEIKDFVIFENLEKLEVVESKEPKEETEFIYIDEKGKEKISIPKVTDYLLSKFTFKTIFGRKDESIYVYDEGIYKLRGREIIKTEIEIILNYRCSTQIVNEIYEKIKRSTAIDYDLFQEVPIDLICLNNGILNLKTKELEPFNSEYYFKTKIPIDYIKTSKAELTIKFIEDMCYPEDVPVMQEWFGFCLKKILVRQFY